MRSIVFVFGFLALLGAAIGGYYMEFVYPINQMTEQLAEQGFTHPSYHLKIFSGHLSFACSSKNSVVRGFEAYDNKGNIVAGTACYVWPWGASIWVDNAN
jgi:hypothetical protein